MRSKRGLDVEKDARMMCLRNERKREKGKRKEEKEVT